jgi:hypothetical protein
MGFGQQFRRLGWWRLWLGRRRLLVIWWRMGMNLNVVSRQEELKGMKE